MRYLALLCAGFGLAFASCGNNPQTSSPATDSTVAAPVIKAGPKSALGDTATSELMNLVSSYYNLKDALVATDAAKADAAAAKLMSDAEGFGLIVSRQGNPAALQPHVETIQQESDALVNTKVDSIETKRAHFSKISDAMYALLRAAELKNGGIYRQFCPMALNDKGANWLSPESEIRNPYFGTKMMECGEVQDSL
jgi:Cu(I)/Ag(I) efflux system membrane fusion protein